MHYRTIVLELLEEQFPALHRQLRENQTLLESVNRCAADLKACHEYWMHYLDRTRPQSDPRLVKSEAMELALKELQDALRLASPPNGNATTGVLALNDAMTLLRRRMPAE